MQLDYKQRSWYLTLTHPDRKLLNDLRKAQEEQGDMSTLKEVTINKYATKLAFRARYDDGSIMGHKNLVRKNLKEVSVIPSEKRKVLQDSMWKSSKCGSLNNDFEFVYSMGMEEYNKTQLKAIKEAVKS